MRLRLAQVLWYAGAFLVVLGGLGAFAGAFSLHQPSDFWCGVTWFALCAFAASPFWAGCYVLGGSFWSPPNASRTA